MDLLKEIFSLSNVDIKIAVDIYAVNIYKVNATNNERKEI